MGVMFIKIAISSNIGYIDKTYDIIVPSLINGGVPPRDINIFISSCPKNKSYINNDNVKIYETTYSSFEFTPLIQIIEDNLYSPYWLLLHDTCEIISNDFYTKLINHPYKESNSVAIFNSTWSCNMGAYKWEYLLSKQNEINQFKNIDTSPSKLTQLKKDIITKEDFLLDKINAFSQTLECQKIETLDGAIKIKDYFIEIGIIKTKTTWNWNKINIDYVN
jgi:hypothetical protein